VIGDPSRLRFTRKVAQDELLKIYKV
jgi:hypothetical protein